LNTHETSRNSIDYTALERDLRNSIAGEVRFDASAKALYAADASNYRQVPIGVVIPKSTDDVVAILAAARKHGAPILSRGGGTSIPGQCTNTAVIIDFSKYLHRIIEIDPVQRLAKVQPGCVLDDLRAAAEEHQLTFGPDPATHKYCTLGGMIGNNSCGVHSIMAGRTADNIHSLEVLLYDGTRLIVGKDYIESTDPKRAIDIRERLLAISTTYAADIRERFPNIPRRVSGYSIDQLLPEQGFHIARALVGSEGTLVTILEATVELVASPPHRVLLVAGYSDIAVAGDHVPTILEHKPIGLEGIDQKFIADMRKKGLKANDLDYMPKGQGWLLAEFGADTVEDARENAERMLSALKKDGTLIDSKIYDKKETQAAIWAVRDSGLGAAARIPGEQDNWEGWEDSAVPPARVGDYLRDFRKLMRKYEYVGSVYGHIGDGCVHTRLNWDVKSKEGVDKWLRFVDEASDLVVSYGGSLSGEHGDGQARAALLPKMFGPRLMKAFEEFKEIFDPNWKMNPGKLIRPYGIDENLRYGPYYNPIPLNTHFSFPDDNGSFARAVERCVGAGVCRKEHEGVMCPSYRVTREEQHVTRGRAHLLWEMMHGDVISDGTRSNEVREALDLCLACKGCTGECPVRVDMPTYKAEFLSHYYKGKLRPRAAYSMGLIYWVSRLASKAPALVNALARIPFTKKLAGVHPKRTMPKFAARTFKKSFFSRNDSQNKNSQNKKDSMPRSAREVILWADTFTNHFRPETALAAVSVLEHAGFRVKVYRESLCCGRPLYDWGMLKTAKKLLLQILQIVDEDISRGLPLVVLEPSCASVFRDELCKLFPEREDAKRLANNTYVFSEFIEQFVMSGKTEKKPIVKAAALLHLHCHHSVLGKESSRNVLTHYGIDPEQLDAGCCGMAGAFGFEKEHYDISLEIGEKKLLPTVRQSNKMVIADGFSCREQIEQTTDRKTLHLAEVLASQIKS